MNVAKPENCLFHVCLRTKDVTYCSELASFLSALVNINAVRTNI